jgi:mannose-1-phosphate guanylyltransferase
MEKSQIVYTLSADFDWTDLGIWSSVIEASTKDENNNVLIGGTVLNESNSNNLIILPGRKKAIIHGLNDMIVVDSGEALLIYPRSEEHKIKASVQKLH